MLLILPNELLLEVICNLSDNLHALRNLSLVCRILVPLVRIQLFANIDVRALGHQCIQPYLGVVRSVSFSSWAFKEGNLASDIIPSLVPSLLPALQSLRFCSLGGPVLPMWTIPQQFFDTLQDFTSITELLLRRVGFDNLSHAQSLICSLPQLDSFSLDGIIYPSSRTLTWPDSNAALAKDVDILSKTRPRLRHLAVTMAKSAYAHPNATLDVVSWLGEGPAVQSLTSLTLIHQYGDISSADILLQHFGPTITHLTVSIRTLAAQIRGPDPLLRYSAVRSLTVLLLPSFQSHHRLSFTRLTHVFKRGAFSQSLHTVTFELGTYGPSGTSGDTAILDMFEQLDEVLSAAALFPMLRTVEIVIDWARREPPRVTVPPAGAEGLLRALRGRMHRLAAMGALVTRYRILRRSDRGF